MVQHALDRGYEVVGVCRDASVEKLDAFKERTRSYRERPTTARSSSAPSPVATAFSSCLPRWASTSTRQEQRKLFSTRTSGARLRVLVRVAHYTGCKDVYS